MRRRFTIWIAALAFVPIGPGSSQAQEPDSRAFYMGFSGQVPDTTLEAMTASEQFVRENSDILAYHMVGVPWQEMAARKDLPERLKDWWTLKAKHQPPGGGVYVAVSPGRGDLEFPNGEGWELPERLRGKSYRHRSVKKAYLHYVRRTIDFLDPDVLVIGIEVNTIPRDRWSAYKKLHRYVYKRIKRSHPELPIAASYALHNLIKQDDRTLRRAKELMRWNDLVAISYYPFFTAGDAEADLDWFFSEFDRFGKPYVMAETGEAAEPTEFWDYNLDGSEAKQADYFQLLFEIAQEKRFGFVISFVHQDFDRLWEQIEAQSPPLFKAWQDTGLLDETGRARLAYDVWNAYLALPVER